MKKKDNGINIAHLSSWNTIFPLMRSQSFVAAGGSGEDDKNSS
jgi:hypothetical protein